MDSAARIVVDAGSHVLEASPQALALLGVTLDQLRALPPGALSPESDREASVGFEDEWRRSGGGPIVGAGTVRLLDGRLLRIRYLITPLDDGTFEVIFERTGESPSQPPRAYTIGNVLSAWRAAERQLQRLEPADPEWSAVTAEVEYFKREYRRLVAVAGSKEATFEN